MGKVWVVVGEGVRSFFGGLYKNFFIVFVSFFEREMWGGFLGF